jgi:hypothetical protein
MNPIERYDGWVRGKVKSCLDWLYEWLSISQKAVERSLIFIYALASAILIMSAARHEINIPIWMQSLISLLMIFFLWDWHTDPSTVRSIKHTHSYHAIFRVLWQFMALTSLFPPYKGKLIDIGFPLADIAFTLFLYVVASNCGGERGRKRKMAWAKLKELFSWLPEPQPEGV